MIDGSPVLNQEAGFVKSEPAFFMRLSMEPFEIIDHTADIGLRVNGRTLEDLFLNAALGLRDLLLCQKPQESGMKRDFALEASTDEELLVDWLGDILYSYEVESFIFTDCRIVKVTGGCLKASLTGGKVDKSDDSISKYDIKAVTFHDLAIRKTKDFYTCTVYFDV